VPARDREQGIFDQLATPVVISTISQLIGNDRWPRPSDWGGLLVTFPTRGEWNVPSCGWHIDFPARGAPGSTLMLKWLGYVTPMAARGGGTVAIAGSHKLVAHYLRQADTADPGRSPTVRDAIFGADPWFEPLRRRSPADRIRLMQEGATVSDVHVRIVELLGQPGDVIFLHPHLLHAPAPNCLSSPRFMVTGGIVKIG
jgi:ectoine hydroxylase-related dioxygenase (phytanoyl-CoA dioxygenase family)